MTPGCSAVSPPINAQPGLAAALVHAGHHGGHLVGVDLAGGDVVEHEQRLGPDAHEVVDAHGDQVDADRVVAAGGAGHHQLGAHPVGRGHQDRLRGSGRVERELPPNPPMPGTMAAQALDGGVAGRDVHAGAGVGGAALSHGGQTPGSAPWWAVTADRLGPPERDRPRGDRRRVVAGEAGVAEAGVGADGLLQVLDA